MSDDEYIHMPWCPDLDHLNSCSLEQQVTDDLAIMLTADQCEPGSVQLEVQGAARSAAELAALVAALEQFAAPVAIADSETSCVGHNHDEDEDEDEDDEDETQQGRAEPAEASDEQSDDDGDDERASLEDAANADSQPGKIVPKARRELEQLLGREAESVSGFERDNGHWKVNLEVVELRRIPDSSDVLGSYELVLDDKGNVARMTRTRRYQRSEVESG